MPQRRTNHIGERSGIGSTGTPPQPIDTNSTGSTPQPVVALDETTRKTTKIESSQDSNSLELCTPSKNKSESRKKSRRGGGGSGGDGIGSSNSTSSTSNSSSNSGSGGDNHYSADCSGDGGSDDNQSSDDTSAKPKSHVMMLDSISAMAAHHHHHHHHHHHQQQQQQPQHKSHQYHKNSSASCSSSNSSSSNDDEANARKKEKQRASYQEGVKQTQQKLSALSTNIKDTTTVSTKISTANHQSRDDTTNLSTGTGTSNSRIDPQIDLSLVNHIPSSSLVLPLHATATAALLQWNQNWNHLPPPLSESTTVAHDILTANTIPSTGMDATTGTCRPHSSAALPITGVTCSDTTVTQPQSLAPHWNTTTAVTNPPIDSGRNDSTIPVPVAVLPTTMWTTQNYMQLMEAVRPFFSMPRMMHHPPLPTHGASTGTMTVEGNISKSVSNNANNNTSNPSSSEGFTSFFTTTTDESGGDRKASTKNGSSEADQAEGATPQEDGVIDDNASMVVLAREKRKYSKNKQRKPMQKMESTTTSSSDASLSNVRDLNDPNCAPMNETNHHQHHTNINGNNHHNNVDRDKVMSRMVTDISSSNPTTTSGSGSGDNGMNTTSGGSGSGTGSNQGSSGSGNDGKGSSEELAKEDSNSGGDGMNGSDGSSNQVNTHRGAGHQGTSSMLDNTMVHAMDKLPQQPPLKNALTESRNGSNVAAATEETATREQKMLVKKRKRIVMRREYEAQQRQMSSSDSSGDSTENFFPPGRPLTLDQILVFSKIPRLIVQSTPPFLIVHVNAAGCRLTKIDAHMLVGKPVSVLLSVPSFPFEEGDIDEETHDDALPIETNPYATTEISHVVPLKEKVDIEARQSLSESIATAHEKRDLHMTIDQLIQISGCDGRFHLVNVNTKLVPSTTDCEEQHKLLCRLSIAPIVVSKQVANGSAIDNHDQSKRARYQGNATGTPDFSSFITHYVMQFELYDNEHYSDTMESQSSSNPVDGQLAGTQQTNHNAPSKFSHHNANQNNNSNADSNSIDHNASNVAEGTDLDGSMSVQSSDREPIVAIG